MEEKKFYNKREVDSMLSTTKENLLKQIEETVTMGTTNPVKPSAAKKSLTLKVVRREVK